MEQVGFNPSSVDCGEGVQDEGVQDREGSLVKLLRLETKGVLSNVITRGSKSYVLSEKRLPRFIVQ